MERWWNGWLVSKVLRWWGIEFMVPDLDGLMSK